MAAAQKFHPLIAGLIGSFARRKPVRAGSLIITLYGDAIVPRGGSLWLGSIAQIMGMFRIDAGHVRTAISRLASEGWLERTRAGRNSYYRLSKQGEGAFEQATQRIYFFQDTEPVRSIRLAILGNETARRTAQREALTAAGYAALNAFTYVSAHDANGSLARLRDIRFIDAPVTEASASLLREAYQLDEIGDAYRGFIEHFGPVAALLRGRAPLSDAEALVVRLLLIQEFRRIVLRDPALPAALLSAGWAGGEARILAARIYKEVLEGAERYLDGCTAAEGTSLPKPNPSLRQRFAAPQ